MKRWICLVLTLLMVLGLAACGGKSLPDEPSDREIKADVEDYIQEMIDETAEVTSFENEDSEITGEKFVATVVAAYEGDNEQGEATFVLTYKVDDGEWVLSKCRMKDAESASDDGEKKESSDSAKLGSSLSDYTFEFDGKVYKLPCAYSVFKDNGWKIKEDNYQDITEDTMVDANSYTYVKIVNGSNAITAYFVNMSGNSKAIKDCKVGGVEVYANDLTNITLFKIAKDISLTSTVDEVKEAFGDANQTNDRDDYVSLRYEGEDSNIYTSFTIYKDAEETKYNTIQLRNFVSDSSDVTETSDEVPEYLAAYSKPDELGSDLKSGNIEVEGDLYTLPCPVSAFLDNGWTFKSKPDAVGSGNRESVSLKRGDKDITVSVKNYASYQTIPENCAVMDVTVWNSDKISVRLPNGITIGSNKADIEYLLNGMSVYEGSSSTSYSTDDYDNGFSLKIYIDKETSQVSEIGLRYDNWRYGG